MRRVFYNGASRLLRPLPRSSFLPSIRFASTSEAAAPIVSPSEMQSLLQQVQNLIKQDNVFHDEIVNFEVNYYFRELGMQAIYFKMFNAEQIANHLHSFIAAKKMAAMAGSEIEHLQFQMERDDGAMYICPATYQDTQTVLKKLGDYLKRTNKVSHGYSIAHFKSDGPCIQGGSIRLSLYIVTWSPYINPNPNPTELRLTTLCTEHFQQSKLPHVLQHYQEMVASTSGALAPVSSNYTSSLNPNVTVVTFGFELTNESYLTHFNVILNNLGLQADKHFVETFSNRTTVYSFYIQNLADEQLNLLRENAKLLGVIDWNSPLLTHFSQRTLTASQVMYCKSASLFSYYFTNVGQHSDEYKELKEALANDHENLGRVNGLRDKLRRENMSEGRIHQCIAAHPDLLRDIYQDFRQHARGNHGVGVVNKELHKKIEGMDISDDAKRILTSFLLFNASILKTNFSKWPIAAASYRLEPSVFLKGTDLPQIPFGLFLVVGNNFRGFHLRFKDISRGGIRIIVSSNKTGYQENCQTLFDENFGLAFTQLMKNKDIPEGGSKGTILLDYPYEVPPENKDLFEKYKTRAFMKYTDAVLDLIVETEGIPDRYGKTELLFFGPDEHTADMMEGAALHAQRRGYRYWKAFTTGKPDRLGGIPHDRYGMTTNSVRAYQTGIMQKLGLKEEEVTKVQTGGPDGDLGSNEILLSKDKTIAIVDGSGVLYDPVGIDRTELRRLAQHRKMIVEFDSSKLTKDGFKVLVAEKNVTLPNGFHVDDGLVFRNQFHLLPFVKADFFVPCGGRPDSINVSNVHSLIKSDKENPNQISLKYKYIVEGANLFITEDARIALDEAGCVNYKDASTNKGGVTSSSFEVFAALAMTDAEYEQHMQVKDPSKVPAFYATYVQQVQNIIKNKATKEFELLWREHGSPANREKKVSRATLTNRLSHKINDLNDFIQDQAHMFEDKELVKAVLAKSLPPILISTVGLDNILARVPEMYLRAVFSANIASGYVYEYGLEANEFVFYEYMSRFERKGLEAAKH